ncbi:HlyD family efflux transporter periplasmic adaptor subunit [Aliiglaciecola sp. 3_MG-2023]|uniref:HlyD family secretion protein n=1 Tax=Aliiglaciecola sp. 3_MG-2023 TaxID=3062644 RepID=UPI0026E40AB5|nr:HlyD family efflux transporter periplasmic adaptor subunit [Aliiglaciecola sp. 3_MG-2023]MDO6692560.1 HlyD family efflux transporter periplasmic adaptor subunit [Aliiglaciecola sp. 3_MG-2023]
MKQGNKLPFIAILVVIVAVGTWMLWRFIQQPSLPSDFASGNGRIEAVQVDISTKIAGRVQEVIAAEGDLVQPQQALARINTDQLEAQLLRAEADVAAGESLIASANASIAQAKAQQLLAKQELSRASDLIKKSAVSKETYDTRVSALAVADASVEAADAMLISRQRNVDALQAVVNEIKTQIEDATLVSPTIGRVLYRLAEPGEVLGSGGKVLTIINLADVYMEVFLPSNQAHRVAIGAEARVKLDIIDYAIPATVSFVSPESQFTPKQVETQNERNKLMFRVKVKIPQELVLSHIEQVKTGVRGVAYIRLAPEGDDSPSEWPEELQNFPPSKTLSEESAN